MYKIIYLLLFSCFCLTGTLAQKYTVEKSTVSFFSDAAIEDIQAKNIETTGLLNVTSGEFAFLIPIKKFSFEKSLMQEHFNEKYLESEKFPNAVFKGIVNGLPIEKQSQEVEAIGKITIHGVTRDVKIPAVLERKGDKILATSSFIIKLEDYQIKIPKLMWQNIAEEIEVNVEIIYKPI